MTVNNLYLLRAEHEQWQELCRQLKECGAITNRDLNTPYGSTDSRGQRLLTDLNFWGDLRARQGMAMVQAKLTKEGA